MRKSHILLMIVAWFGLATYVVLDENTEETEGDQATGLNQKIQAQNERIKKLEAKMAEIEKHLETEQQAPPSKPRTNASTERVREELIEKLQAQIMVEIEKQLEARQQVSPPKSRDSANPTLQEHLDATQELHIAEDAAKPHVPHPTQKHLQTIRRLHEVRHKTNESHLHPPVHIH